MKMGLNIKIKRTNLVVIFTVLVIVLFLSSLFHRISYPLIWNDEGETAIYGQRILQYGYPKIDDGKNRIFLSWQPDRTLGIKKSNDAYIFTTWSQYYLAALGVYFGKSHINLYQKTALLRIPFAAIGLLGLFLFVLCLRLVLKNGIQRRIAILLFLFFELISISLVLHLREARYYSIIIFLTALIFYLYIQYRIVNQISYSRFLIGMTISLILYYHTYFTGYFVLMSFFICYECLLAFQKWILGKKEIGGTPSRRLKNPSIGHFGKRFLPYVLSLILLIPSFIYFDMYNVLTQISNTIPLGLKGYQKNLVFIFSFFIRYDIFYLILFVKILYLLFRRLKAKNPIPEFMNKMAMVSNLFLCFFLYNVLATAKMPFLFERYFINLQPVLAGMATLDIIFVWHCIALKWPQAQSRRMHWAFAVLLVGILTVNGFRQKAIFKGFITEKVVKYRGPLDFMIPFIQQQCANSEDLVVATNYEECSFIYYLNCRILIGYNYDNVIRDAQERPDIIIYRKKWKWLHDPDVFNDYLKKEQYICIRFPVYDYPVNNIPELNFHIGHLFETLYTPDLGLQTKLFIKKSLFKPGRKSSIPYMIDNTNRFSVE